MTDNIIPDQDYRSLGYSNVEGTQFEADMRLAFPKIDFETFWEMPDEWRNVLCPDYNSLRNYGANFYYIQNFLTEFQNSKIRNEFLNNLVPFVNEMDEAGSWDSFNDSLIRLNKVADDRYVPMFTASQGFMTIVGVPVPPTPLLSGGIFAFQHRHLATPNSDFTMEDYNILTAFYRKFWGKLHPEDESSVGD